jgi:NADP-dependent 3-hydroxy acid dehydrogenase YdfG
MPTIAVVGAGPGLGLSIAARFGSQGYRVALVSRSRSNLDRLVAQLEKSGVTAGAFPADVADRPALTAALEGAAKRLGPIDVMEYSPYSGLESINPDEVTADNLRPAIETILYGAVTASRTVLPGMLAAGTGTLLFTVGGGALNPYPMLATINTAQAGLRNWAHNLHNTVGDKGVHVATVAINVFIGSSSPAEGVPHAAADDLAQIYWDLHARRDKVEHFVG